MSRTIDDLLGRIQVLRDELELELQRKREEIAFVVHDKRVRFTQELSARHQLYKIGLLDYLRGARWRVVVTAPAIYLGIIPISLLDMFTTVYQRTCFPAYGIATVRRQDYMVFDRGDLPYLNIVERVNCLYCSYANGVAAYFREVAARTEQYWCPIKHARRILDAHENYLQYAEFGDAEAYRNGLLRLREQYRATPDRPRPLTEK